MNLNEHVNVDTELSLYADKFYPDDGYALWDDTETANLDENGDPIQYYLQINILKRNSEAMATHIWARLIDDTMEVFGTTEPDQPVMKARAMSMSAEPVEESHTYIDESGVERQKKGVY